MCRDTTPGDLNMSVLRLILITAFSMLFTSTLALSGTPEQKVIAVQQAKIEALQKQLSQFKGRMAKGTMELHLLQCEGKHYNCSVRSCVNLCLANGGRVAHRHELAELALKGQNHCAFTLSYDASNDRFDRSYPMFNFQGGGCHNASQIPVMPLMPVTSENYNTPLSANCSCMLPIKLD